MRIVFRVDASQEIGWGHAMRCVALADAYASRGASVGFISASWPDPLHRLIVARRFDFQRLPQFDAVDWKSDAEATIFALKSEKKSVDWFVVDHYQLDHRWEEYVANGGMGLFVIDDLANRPHACAALLDQTLDRVPAEYAQIVPPMCKLLLGSQYALLRPQFLRARAAALARRDSVQRIERILVSLGATDVRKLMPTILAGIASSGMRIAVDLMVGVEGGDWGVLLHEFRSRVGSLNVIVGTEDVADVMTRADLAIGAAGTSSWERCALGLPTLILTVAENQHCVAESLVKAGAAEHLGLWSHVSPETISTAINRLVDDIQALRTMSAKAASICDGRGTDRVCLVLGQEATATDERTVTLRLASAQDELCIYRWQADPRTRRFARNPSTPSLEEHSRWIEQSLIDPDRLLMILEHEGEPAGVLRLDATEGSDIREISIFVSPEKYRLGIAKAGLRLVNNLFPGWTIWAEVLPSNVASQRLFEGVGYERVGPTRYSRRPYYKAES